MKKETNDISQLQIQRPEHILHREMTGEEKAQAAILSQKSFLKEKYRYALKLTTQMKVHEYAQTNPEWGTKDVLIAILKGYNSQLPSIVILEMVQFIMNEWENITINKKELVYS